jgi:hypothetical protein
MVQLNVSSVEAQMAISTQGGIEFEKQKANAFMLQCLKAIICCEYAAQTLPPM